MIVCWVCLTFGGGQVHCQQSGCVSVSDSVRAIGHFFIAGIPPRPASSGHGSEGRGEVRIGPAVGRGGRCGSSSFGDSEVKCFFSDCFIVAIAAELLYSGFLVDDLLCFCSLTDNNYTGGRS